jgi:hypothetical protein
MSHSESLKIKKNFFFSIIKNYFISTHSSGVSLRTQFEDNIYMKKKIKYSLTRSGSVKLLNKSACEKLLKIYIIKQPLLVSSLSLSHSLTYGYLDKKNLLHQCENFIFRTKVIVVTQK